MKFSSLLLKMTAAAVVVILGFFSFYIVYILKTLDVLPDLIFLLLSIFIILLFILLAMFIMVKKPFLWQKILCLFLVFLIGGIEGTGAFYLYKTDQMLHSITSVRSSYSSSAQVIVMKDAFILTSDGLKGKSLGVLRNLDQSSSSAVLDTFEQKGINVEKKEYDGILDLIEALYIGEVDSIVMNSSFRSTILDTEEFSNFDAETKVIDEIVYSKKRSSTTVAVDDITSTPFTILVSGSDSRDGLEETARSDVNMLVTVNPTEKTILLTGIPRDFYTPMVCDADAWCPYGQYDKLTHTGLFGVETTKKTIEEAFDITINYIVRVNFDSVINLVEALGGIDVFIEEGLAVESFWTYPGHGVHEGMNTLDGETALALSRERYAYLDGDHQRVRNQQIVLEAIFKKATSPAMIVQYNKFMDALAGAMETDVSDEEIQDLIKFQLDGNPDWTFYEYNASGEGGYALCAAAGSTAYVMYPDYTTVNTITELIQACLDGNIELMNQIINGEEILPDENLDWWGEGEDLYEEDYYYEGTDPSYDFEPTYEIDPAYGY